MTAASAQSPDGKRVVAIIRGGLGNQLFIYAAARALAIRSGRQLYLDTVRGYVADDFGRSYRLDRFAIAAQVMPESWRIAPSLSHSKHKLIRALNKLLPSFLRSYIAERKDVTPETMRNLDSLRAQVTLLGYWQDENYFTDAADILRTELTPPLPASASIRQHGEQLHAQESVFVHVRRVRYSPLLGAGYYQQAINSARASLQQPVFVIFGDDLAWARRALDFGDASVEFQSYDEADELADLWLMTQCRHAIIANSSFSWWAAWLGQYPERKVWAPAQTGLPLVNAGAWIPVAPEFSVRNAGTG